MKNKEFLIGSCVKALIAVGMLQQLLVFITTPCQPLRELLREEILLAFLAWFVSVLFRQNRDDDDWVGQF